MVSLKAYTLISFTEWASPTAAQQYDSGLLRCHATPGFLHRRTLLRKMRECPEDVEPFLVYCILSITAGNSPRLVALHGSAKRAGDIYRYLASDEVRMQRRRPSLETARSATDAETRGSQS